MSRITKRTRSPYQRYNKTPWRYPDALRAWQEAIRRGDPDRADELDRQWRSARGIPQREDLPGASLGEAFTIA